MAERLVDTEQGTLRGCGATDYHGGKFFKFLGVPYARAPTGELRFKAPQPPEKWDNIRDATKEGPECPSGHMYFTYHVGNENNCLTLNVYTKELHKGNSELKKPVMVWIHGGAFTTGSNKSELYGPDYLMTQDIVLVTINYRLGILGFASFKDPSLDVPGNAGLKDQRMALVWVKNNIQHFGGDPNNVTIFGESAGAASVHYLTLSPTTQGLFHKAIIQSGSALNNWSWGKNNSAEIAKCMNYKETDERKILEKLRKESAKNIFAGQKRHKEGLSAATVRPWGPVVEPPSDHAFLTESPAKLMHSEGAHKIPMIIGYNSNEGILFELVRKTYPYVRLPDNFEHEIPFELGLEHGSDISKEIARKMREKYFGDDHCNEKAIEKVYQFKGDINFVHSIQRTMKLQAALSHQPVYAYRMSLHGPLNYFRTFALSKNFKTTIFYTFLSKISPVMKKHIKNTIQNAPLKDLQGVAHADDLFHLFPTFFTPTIQKGSLEDLYIQRFVKLWANFAKYGEPTPDSDETLNNIKWNPLSLDNIQFLDIGDELRMIQNVDEDRMQFWNELYDEHYKL